MRPEGGEAREPAAPARQRTIVTGPAVLRLARGVRLRFDARRVAWLLLAPERVIVADDTAAEILQRIDGTATVDAIVDDLALRFDAPRAEIAADVAAMLQDLADQGCVTA